MDSMLASYEDKIRYFNQIMSDTLQTLGFESAVLHVGVDADRFFVMRWPSCTHSCPSPDTCSSIMIRTAATNMLQQAVDIDDGLTRPFNDKAGFKS